MSTAEKQPEPPFVLEFPKDIRYSVLALGDGALLELSLLLASSRGVDTGILPLVVLLGTPAAAFLLWKYYSNHPFE
jgi:hypothetical protein